MGNGLKISVLNLDNQKSDVIDIVIDDLIKHVASEIDAVEVFEKQRNVDNKGYKSKRSSLQ